VIGGLAGGFIAESLGFSFEVGAMIGSIVGGVLCNIAERLKLRKTH